MELFGRPCHVPSFDNRYKVFELSQVHRFAPDVISWGGYDGSSQNGQYSLYGDLQHHPVALRALRRGNSAMEAKSQRTKKPT
jgi:hypothetical protein